MYIAELEARLQEREKLLQKILPGVDLEDPDLDNRLLADKKAENKPPIDLLPETLPTTEGSCPKPWLSCDEQEMFLDLKFEVNGSLTTDEQGNCDYHGYFAGLTFLQRMREQCGQLLDGTLEKKSLSSNLNLTQVFTSSKALASRKAATALQDSEVLPSRQTARHLVSVALDNACCHMRFVHRPTFDRRLDRIYDLEPESYGDDEHEFLPLLYIVLAIGVLFSKEDAEKLGIERIKFEA